mmetsp:Transcript_2688/g.3679  ORF Transcript_2688/g.3679 Transcript_2688/m.3679 type:complete len:810 (+) Transcript_2688:55-2484(+)
MSIKHRKNMNYKDLFDKMIAQLNTRLVLGNLNDIEGAPYGLVMYRLPDEKTRANVSTLGLSDDHDPRNPTFHVFHSFILVSKAFASSNFSSTLYCAWIETHPSVIIFWEWSPIDGITDKINQDRFTRFKSLGIASPIHPKISAPTNENLDKFSNSKIAVSEFVRELSITSVTEMNNLTDNKVNSNINERECEARDRRKVIEEFLANSTDFSALSIDDDDTIDTMSTLQDIFDDVCPLGDIMIAARRNQWQNMNKIILNEFKSKWEGAIAHVKETKADKFLPDSEWLDAMWLYVIGCPSDVRSKMDLLSAIQIAFSKLKGFEEVEILDKLKSVGFRPSLAQWICDLCSSEDFEDDVLKVATCIPWNSYLFSREGIVHYTHLHCSGSDFQAVDDAHPVILSVAGVDGLQRRDIHPLELDMPEESWTPVNFAEAAFEKLKSISNPDSYILGHCCSEQSIVSISKTGMSPLATFKSEQSCGHGMYFFELNHDVFQLSFHELNLMALQDLPDAHLDPRGLQFRAFVYALNVVFRNPKCDAMSPCVLVFLIPTNIRTPTSCLEPFDAVTNKLPMCNDDNSDPSSWKCTCTPLFSYQNNLPIIDSTEPMTASAIYNAISMVQENDIEKINALALLGGIVDFRRIQQGVYTAIVTGNYPKKVLDSLKSMKEWNTSTEKFETWKTFVTEPSGSFRWPKTVFNYRGGFSHIKPVNSMRQGVQLKHWSVCPADPIRETVFVHTSALVKLLENATAINVVFLNPGNEWTQRMTDTCHLKETEGEIFSEALARAPPVESNTPDTRHRFWKNVSSCGCYPFAL